MPAPIHLTWTTTPTEAGLALIAYDAAGVRAILLGDDPTALRAALVRRWPRAGVREVAANDPMVATVRHALDAQDDGPARAVVCAPTGTPFQRLVWDAVCAIPRGETRTYRDLAEQVGRPTAARAVAAACAANPLAVVIPCHRVVSQRGALGGYRWGVARKRALLAREGVRADRRDRTAEAPEI